MKADGVAVLFQPLWRLQLTGPAWLTLQRVSQCYVAGVTGQ